MNITLLQRFVALDAEGLHAPRAANALGIPLASLYSSIDKLEAEVGHPLLKRDTSPWTLTPAGTLLLEEAQRRIAAEPAPAAKPVVPAGGKAKASKGKGRAPKVKGQPKPYKKRQGR
ncbi:LysR family transcriptional regulator [Agromyces sp. MMS24-JH15]|uniref:LysR family transcriptional regulator n=1 Tax=Agromyces sp. MMS24-JH15 TaxID=3243765 RepID=UPI00374998A2